jgi:hypothetical protein
MKARASQISIAVAIVFFAAIYGFVHRYSYHVTPANSVYVFDHWTGRGGF